MDFQVVAQQLQHLASRANKPSCALAQNRDLARTPPAVPSSASFMKTGIVFGP